MARAIAWSKPWRKPCLETWSKSSTCATACAIMEQAQICAHTHRYQFVVQSPFIHTFIHSSIYSNVTHQHSVLGCHISYSLYIIVTILAYSVTTKYCSALYCPYKWFRGKGPVYFYQYWFSVVKLLVVYLPTVLVLTAVLVTTDSVPITFQTPIVATIITLLYHQHEFIDFEQCIYECGWVYGHGQSAVT